MITDLQDKLIHAIWSEKIVDVEVLLNSGADVNAAGPQGRTPLMQAAEMENLSIARLLLDRGADVNRAGYRGYTPLHIAVDISIDGTIQKGGHPGDEPTEMIDLLIKRGASISAEDDEGKTPLGWAVAYGSKRIGGLLKAWQKNQKSQGAAPNAGSAGVPPASVS
jgi:ankyrin repeat protein